MRVGTKHMTVVLLLALGMPLVGASPCFAAVGAVRIEGADRYETSAKTASAAY